MNRLGDVGGRYCLPPFKNVSLNYKCLCFCPWHFGFVFVFWQIILKEREGKKGKSSVEQESSGQEEHGEECLHFTDDLPREPASQEGMANSLSSRFIFSFFFFFFFTHEIFSNCNFCFVTQIMVWACPVMHPSRRPVRTLHIASPQYPRVPLLALALEVPWLQTPSPRSTADVSESKYALLPDMEWETECWRGHIFCRIPLHCNLKNAQRGGKKWFTKQILPVPLKHHRALAVRSVLWKLTGVFKGGTVQ